VRGDHKDYSVPVHQADAVLNQASPVSGTKYTVLETTNVRILSLTIICTWTVQPTPLQLHITVDGQTIVHAVGSPVSATQYIAFRTSGNAEAAQTLGTTDNTKIAFIYEGRNIKVEAEITGGTVSNLSARVKHAKW